MEFQPRHYIDGRILYYSFIAGAQNILRNQVELNNINVFPVNDKDTGTNLASTVRSIMDNLKPDRSFSVTAEGIAEAALIGARGNSGIIFAQFFHGISIASEKRTNISFPEFAEIIENSINFAFDAVSNPVEGTILTIMRDWADFFNSRKEAISNFNDAFIDSYEILKSSLSETKDKILVLKQNNLVDAGAKGFVVFVEGIIDLIRHANIRELFQHPPQTVTFSHHDIHKDQDIHYRYCTEAIVKDLKISNHELRHVLEKYGDSCVVAGSEKNIRFHIHTNQPAQLFHEIKDFGTVTSQKADDMVRQNEIATLRKGRIALVTDSTCDLDPEIIDYYQISLVPININFGEQHYLDKVTINPNQFYDLLESSPAFPRTSQVNERVFSNLYSHLATYYDSIIAIHLTSRFSGTYSSSLKAAEKISKEFNKPIHVIDSKSLSGALGLIVLRTAMEIEKEVELPVLLKAIDSWIGKTKIYVSVKTLKFMVKGGRVSKPKGFISGLLNIKPIISMDSDGNSKLIGKTFSQSSNVKMVIQLISKEYGKRKIWNYILLHAHNSPGAMEYGRQMKQLTDRDPVSTVDISPVIGSNAGIGATAIAVMFD